MRARRATPPAQRSRMGGPDREPRPFRRGGCVAPPPTNREWTAQPEPDDYARSHSSEGHYAQHDPEGRLLTGVEHRGHGHVLDGTGAAVSTAVLSGHGRVAVASPV